MKNPEEVVEPERKSEVINGLRVSMSEVLHSAAGYYIGRVYLDEEFDTWLPYDRQSGYYKTYPVAKKALDSGIWFRP